MPDMFEAALAPAGEENPRALPEQSEQPGRDPIMVGGLLTQVPGRTDLMEISVPADAYVLPADVVSALGEGNTLAGVKVLEDLFGAGQFEETDDRPPIPIIAAGGEFVVTPAQVLAAGGGDMEAGHDELDRFVKGVRAELVKTLKKLPGPAR
ncbi:hypothetical protein OIU35_31515 [Boseaceae bacterium BT-24-1]|nr:hypothetical protein [Boseaceae bacterium BT-24-1]